MQLGAMNNPMIDIVEEIQLISDLGFDFIDLTLEPEETSCTKLDADRVRRAVDAGGLDIVGHTAWYLPVASPYPEIREVAIAELKRCMQLFQDLGVKKMNLHPMMKVPLHEMDWIIAQNVDALARLVEMAEPMGIHVMLENMPNFSRVSHIKPILEAVPEAMLLLDVGHANLDSPYNHTEEILAHFGTRLAHVHVSDNRGGHDDMHLPLGVGNINWVWVVRALKNASYDGTITIEVFGDDDDYLVMSRDKLKRIWDLTDAGE